MKLLKTTMIASGMLLGLSGLLNPASAQTNEAKAAQTKRGHELMLKVGCHTCHGTVGQGSTVTGPTLAPKVLPYDGFAAYVRAPTREMPPYSEKVLSEPDLQAIHAYLSSVPEAPAADSIKLLPKPTPAK